MPNSISLDKSLAYIPTKKPSLVDWPSLLKIVSAVNIRGIIIGLDAQSSMENDLKIRDLKEIQVRSY